MQTFFTDAVRDDGTPVVVEYFFTYSSRSTVEVTFVRAWRKSDEDDLDAPDVEATDDEVDRWCDEICEKHVDDGSDT